MEKLKQYGRVRSRRSIFSPRSIRSASKFASRVESDTIFRENSRKKFAYCVLFSLSAPTIFMRGDSYDATRECLSFS